MERGEYSVGDDPSWRIEARRLIARGLKPHHETETKSPTNHHHQQQPMLLSMKQLRVRQRAPDVRRVSSRPPPAAFMDNRLAVKETTTTAAKACGQKRLEVVDFSKAETFQKLKEENENNLKVKQLEGSGGADTAKGTMLQSKESEQAAANMTTTSNNLRREELEYESERGMGKGNRVPLLCLSQKTATKKPVLLLIHDLGKSMYDFLERMEGLARSGYLCCAIDCRHHGGRAQSPRALHNAMRQALLANPSPTTTATTTSSSLFGDSAFDVIALLDYLVKRPDVDPTRIGIFGVGTGGDIALVASAIDCRIRCTAVLPRIFSIGSIVDKGHWESFVTGLKYQSLAYMGDDLSSVFGGAMPSAQEEALHEVLSENRPELVHGTRLGEQEEDDESLRREKREDLKACLEKLSVGITDHFDGKATVAQIVPRPLCLIVEEDKEYIVEEAKRSIGSLPKGLKGDAQLHCVTLSERNKKLGQVDSLVDAFFEKHFLPPPSPKAESSSAIRTCAALGMTRSSDPILSAAKYGAFVACPIFCGKREGYEYEDGNHGLGYYFVGGELQ